MRFIAAALLVISIAACQSSDRQGTEEKVDSTVLQAPYATVFYDSLQLAMESYYSLTEGLTQANITYIDRYSAALKQHLDSLPLNTLQMDSGRLANVKNQVTSMSAELSGLVGEKALEEKRAAFDMVSGLLFDLIKVTGVKGKTIYRQYCPMALKDAGGYWLSNSSKKINPYFGNDMLGCVEVTDSLKFN
jgi:Cu(I)/Ag(I) efflux system membrane fusion protein